MLCEWYWGQTRYGNGCEATDGDEQRLREWMCGMEEWKEIKKWIKNKQDTRGDLEKIDVESC